MDYNNGKIYAIRSNQTELFYIGSTCSNLSKRFYEHKAHYKCYLEGKGLFYSSYDILKFDDAYIELLEEYPCENREQLNKREGEFIRDNNCSNKRVSGRTLKEYYDDNRDKMIEYSKEYYENNKDRVLKQQRKYQEQNKDKIEEYSKKYREEHRDKLNEYARKWRQQNKNKLSGYNKEYHQEYYQENKDKLSEKVNCECGGHYSRYNKSHHLNSKKHQKFVSNNNVTNNI